MGSQVPTGAGAVEAAVAVARANGLVFAEPASIGAASNVLVHLRPAPVVARVMTATAVLHSDLGAWLERELEVGAFLAQRGSPIVPPTDLIDPGPYAHAGYWMSFWKFIEHDAERRLEEPARLGRCLHELHAQLAEFPGPLPPLADVGEGIGGLIDGIAAGSDPGQTTPDALRAELERLRPLVFETDLPAQPLHGDVSLSNLLPADGNLLWNDLEDVCHGPVEWDLASLVVSLRDRGASARFIDDVLRTYGGAETTRLTHFIDAHALYGEVWQAFQAARSP